MTEISPSSVTPASTMTVVSDRGSGRAFVIVFDDPSYAELASGIADRLSERTRVVVVRSESIGADTWKDATMRFAEVVNSLSVRQASYVCFGAAAVTVQNLALNEPKVVRSLVIVDAASRPHPSRLERLLDRLEEQLPFGLPLRLGLRGFNVRAYLHRLRCPLLIVTTYRASQFLRDEARSMAVCSPTSWLIDLKPDVDESQQLAEIVRIFQDTPVKCPQKNRSERASQPAAVNV